MFAAFSAWVESTWLSKALFGMTWLWPTCESLHFIGLCMLIGGAGFIAMAWRVLRSRAGEGDPAQNKPAFQLFGYSILYLFVLFAALLVEKGFGV